MVTDGSSTSNKRWYNFHIKYNQILGTHFYFTLGFLQCTSFSATEHSSFGNFLIQALFFFISYFVCGPLLSCLFPQYFTWSSQNWKLFFFKRGYGREKVDWSTLKSVYQQFWLPKRLKGVLSNGLGTPFNKHLTYTCYGLGTFLAVGNTG